MLAAIPLFGSRVSPRCFFAELMVVARVESGKIVSRYNHPIRGFSEESLLDELVQLKVDTLICGGADREFIDDAGVCGVRVIDNVAGEIEEILAALEAGTLVPGFGLSLPGQPRIAEKGFLGEVDCMQCAEKSCLAGARCQREEFRESLFVDPAAQSIRKAAHEVGSHEARPLCRVEEVIRFAQRMGYRRLGVAFCAELFREAEILCETLGRFFEIVPVCCRIGSRPGLDADETGHCFCNVINQAEALNRSGVELNLMVGLCVGCDIIFASRSLAPATTLIVKDRPYNHNPAGALHSLSRLGRIGEGNLDQSKGEVK